MYTFIIIAMAKLSMQLHAVLPYHLYAYFWGMYTQPMADLILYRLEYLLGHAQPNETGRGSVWGSILDKAKVNFSGLGHGYIVLYCSG